ncbi:hypothetical protein SPI_05674 [Niveomyces insectorum RCEF 264]|uniref:DUF7689 domain-containing protein n=1 Tax=Niveomyces insectorum RCEF 264 TaxID=1081102 RepID=A0A167TFK9_9HYPO|nr:hypothetical protein SPI_05674 [Niveomyces insectorum RCEF 264]
MSAQSLTRFEQDIIRDHSAASPGNFTVHWGTEDPLYNCFAFCINETRRKVTPSTLADLIAEFNSYGYFKVESQEPFQAYDVEVYARHNIPLHAHRIRNTTFWDCESKMGEGPIITHHRNMLESPRTNRSNEYKFGTIVSRFRYDEEQHKVWWLENFAKTASGRVIRKRDAAQSTSGNIYHRNDVSKTKSGRIVKKPAKHGTSTSGNKTARANRGPGSADGRRAAYMGKAEHGGHGGSSSHGRGDGFETNREDINGNGYGDWYGHNVSYPDGGWQSQHGR